MFSFRNLIEREQINKIPETKWHSKKRPQNKTLKDAEIKLCKTMARPLLSYRSQV
jgi:hypothetical protein